MSWWNFEVEVQPATVDVSAGPWSVSFNSLCNLAPSAVLRGMVPVVMAELLGMQLCAFLHFALDLWKRFVRVLPIASFEECLSLSIAFLFLSRDLWFHQ